MRRLIIMLLAAVMLFASVSAGAEASENNPVLTVGNTTKVSGSFFTTQFGNNTSDMDVRAMIHGYSPVMWANQLGYAADPQVTESIEKSGTLKGTVYTITLQKDLCWNDGTPINARDYVFSLLMLSSPEFAALGADTGAWAHILGYDKYAAGETDVLRGVNLIDSYTFSVTVKAEYQPYFYEFSYLAVCPYPISVLAPGCQIFQTADGAMIADANTPYDEQPQQTLYTAELLQSTVLGDNGYLHQPILTCGPYSMTGYDRESGCVTFAVNPFYKGNYEGIKPTIESVKLVALDQATMVDDLKEGRVDVLNKMVNGDVITTCLTDLAEGYGRANYSRLGYGFLAFACEKGPQQYQAVRQAVAYSFDAAAFTADVLKGFGLQVYGYYGMGQWPTMAANGTLRPKDADEETLAQWDEITLDGFNSYDLDLNKAEQLLIADGWVLNETGLPFDKNTDTVRCKDTGDSLLPLTMHFAMSDNSAAAAYAAHMLETNFAQIGGQIVIHEVTFNQLLSDYYHENGDRQFDINFMATNFVSTFDPYMTLVSGTDYDGAMNTSGLQDEELVQLAWDMRCTPAMDLLTYLGKWKNFQLRYNEVLPTLPIYSNVYFDFFTDRLTEYHPDADRSWAEAILYASFN